MDSVNILFLINIALISFGFFFGFYAERVVEFEEPISFFLQRAIGATLVYAVLISLSPSESLILFAFHIGAMLIAVFMITAMMGILIGKIFFTIPDQDSEQLRRMPETLSADSRSGAIRSPVSGK